MNRSLKLSMLIALALGSSQVMAVDLGQIQVKSALGQPLLAEIPLHPESPAELQGLTVQLASSEEFARAGIVGGRTAVPLHFSVATAGAGQPVIRITSSTPVDDPFLDLLIEVNGKAGKSVREYAILLDPPNSSQAAPVATTPTPSAQHQKVTRPAKAAAEAPATKAAAPAKPVKAAAAKPAPAPATAEAGNGQTAPVERGQTLSGIARSVTPSGVDVQQMMLALQQANPNAFYRNNINALKTGVVLRVPTSAEAQAMTIAAAVAEVRRQNSDWRAGTPGKPAVVANAATRTSNAGASTGAPDTGDRLALMPAKANTGAGSQGGGAAGNGARQELLRTKESLASLQQQITDLKARVKDLADINSKNERLLSLKDNEIAGLQAKLAAARKAANQPAAAAPAGTASNTKATGAVPAAPVEKLETATATASTAASVAAAPVAAATASSPAAASSPASAPAHASTLVTTPIATSAATKPVEKPATTAPAHMPAPLERPWYMQTWAWAAAGGAVVLLILLAMLGRRRKPATEASKAPPSLADRFGSSAASAQDLPGGDVDQDELLDQLAEHPDDISLHLELVTLYYSRRDVEHFEAAAEAMHAHIVDPEQDEWQDVLHMGEDLAPGHPLFDHHAEPALSGEAEARGAFNIDDYADKGDAPTVVSTMPPLPPSGPKPVSEYNFNFDLTRTAGEAAARPASTPPPAADDTTVVAPLASSRPAPAEPVSSWHFEEDDSVPLATDAGHDLGEFSDDPVDTKLDLARAYIDMGDAEGARAMLGEVVKEGSQMQKDVAKRLLDSLH
ncbi:fimbrial protein FimV [Rhodanobacter thiooxydans]|uniref:Fimbrial protein FimV n=1 Tax=Rhodanobacter thiooxydans TaxID=416169 RepID=A0A154QG89_9GAMM|nr:FimV/HubP family polar landmark protein [Rhodanobacter thiooxydans]EIM02030.1 FimV N-terminal domain-containing protein [Rhodanobacter thiooxydans LCS2]KZC23196.1 fimbrial protein FimV [Rhodanobacter thiooxydans]MCW0201992.1 fimbrial protein FimV [Rhodanobacter thiooxydans]